MKLTTIHTHLGQTGGQSAAVQFLKNEPLKGFSEFLYLLLIWTENKRWKFQISNKHSRMSSLQWSPISDVLLLIFQRPRKPTLNTLRVPHCEISVKFPYTTIPKDHSRLWWFIQIKVHFWRWSVYVAISCFQSSSDCNKCSVHFHHKHKQKEVSVIQ